VGESAASRGNEHSSSAPHTPEDISADHSDVKLSTIG
jgi:hypothetical protein